MIIFWTLILTSYTVPITLASEKVSTPEGNYLLVEEIVY